MIVLLECQCLKVALSLPVWFVFQHGLLGDHGASVVILVEVV